MAATDEQTSLQNRINNAVDTVLFNTVMASLKVDPTEVPPYSTLNDTEVIDVMTLTDQIVRRHKLIEYFKNVHCSRCSPPSTDTVATVSEGLYGVRYNRPVLDGTGTNLLSLRTLLGRRTGDFTPFLALDALFTGLDEPHSSYSRTEVNCYRQLTLSNLTGLNGTANGGLDWSQVRGQPVRTDQTDWILTVALPESQLHGLIQGTVDPTVFTHSQGNFWFTVRSSLLRLFHMTLQGNPLATEESICVLMFNPLKENALDDFNRLYIDHCKTTIAGEMYHFAEVELRTAVVLKLEDFTLDDFLPLRNELNMRTWFGSHCRGLMGHLVITDSLAAMLQMSRTEATASYQLGTDDAHDDEPMEITDNTTVSDRLQITLNGVTAGFTMKVNKAD